MAANIALGRSVDLGTAPPLQQDPGAYSEDDEEGLPPLVQNTNRRVMYQEPSDDEDSSNED